MGNNVYVSELKLTVNGVTQDVELEKDTRKRLSQRDDRIELIKKAVEEALN